ncbi:MAG TPA: EAL domain-containing protein, partial [Hyphomicrobium sp.]|nr:EAL domain-containing protein [Hyphomicrobium sp.]
MPKLSGMADLIVKGAIVLVTAAVFIGAYLQFQMPFWPSLIAALSVCTVLLTAHVLKRRSERERELAGELARLQDEVERLRTPGAANAALPGMRAPRAPALAVPGAPRAPMPPPLSAGPSLSAGVPMGSPPAPSAAAGAEPSLSMAPSSMTSPMAPGATAPKAASPKAVPPPPPPRGLRAEPGEAAMGAMPPREPRLTTQQPGPGTPGEPQRAEPQLPGRAGAREAAAPRQTAGAAVPAAPRLKLDAPAASNLDAPNLAAPGLGVPNLGAPSLKVPAAPSLKADASAAPTLPDWSAPPPAPAASSRDQMHGQWSSRRGKPTLPEAPRAEPSLSSDRETDLDAVHGMIKRLAEEVDVGGDEQPLEGLPQRQESALRASLNALQTTANVMRAGKKKPGAAGAQAGGAMPPPIMPSHTRLASLAEAVASGRIDVALAPVVGLDDHQVHYHEVLARPCDERGMPLSASTRDPQLAVAGLLPLLDSARLRQAAVVARTFANEGREAHLFVPATAVSLANDGFLDELAAAYQDREMLAGQLVLTFAQADIRTFGNSEWSALTDMRDLGFRFGIEDVTDFDYEFTALCAAGFAFVKVDAATLMAGLVAPNGTMPAGEVCRSLNDLGLTVIVGGIAD